MTNIDKSEKEEKCELILSKVELPSVKMLLSQQGELASFNSNKIEIACSATWFNVIEMRRLIIENAVKKIFGEQIRTLLNYLEQTDLLKNKDILRCLDIIAREYGGEVVKKN